MVKDSHSSKKRTTKGKPQHHYSLSFQEVTDPKPKVIRLTSQETKFIYNLHRFCR